MAAPAKAHQMVFPNLKILGMVLEFHLENHAHKGDKPPQQIFPYRLNRDVETSNKGCLDEKWVPPLKIV